MKVYCKVGGIIRLRRKRPPLNTTFQITLVPNKPVTKWLKDFSDLTTDTIDVPSPVVLNFVFRYNKNLKRISKGDFLEYCKMNGVEHLKSYKDTGFYEDNGWYEIPGIDTPQLWEALEKAVYKRPESDESMNRKHQNVIRWLFKEGEGLE